MVVLVFTVKNGIFCSLIGILVVFAFKKREIETDNGVMNELARASNKKMK